MSLIELKVKEEGKYVLFTVSDNGSGMDDDILSYIYNPGFSTKFDEKTGDICRGGIGLTMVKSLVQDTFMGVVDVTTEQNKGTTFSISIPIEALEVGG